MTGVVFIFHFGLFYTLNNQKNQNKKKKEKKPGDIIILHMCTKNYDHMMYSSRDIVHEERTD